MSDVKHTEERTETHACDLIARHDAIDTVRHLQTYKLAEGDDMLLVDLADVQTELMMMPSAEPEIIRCKECKHRDPEDKKCDCGHDIRWQLPRGDEWYCADAERGQRNE